MSVKSFKERVLKVVRKIPKGKVLTYKEVARLAGSPLAWRSVGNILKNNNDYSIPCFRVVKSNGEIGRYNKGKRKKLQFLKREGIMVKNYRIVKTKV